MDISELAPIVLFDNHCYACTKFAGIVNFLAGGRLSMIGHYSGLGKKLRDHILDESALEMFWLIDKRHAYGGRAALLPLIRSIISTGSRMPEKISGYQSCGQECRTAGSVFKRSASMLSNSKRIALKSK